MKSVLLSLFAAVLVFTTGAVAQNSPSGDSPFQVNYAANLAVGDSVINITNAGGGVIGTEARDSITDPSGNLCVNVYTFSPDEQLVSCCSCTVTPNGLVSLSARNDLISNTLTPAVPGAIVIKLLATAGGTCNAATPGIPVAGLAAWGTTLHALPAGGYALTERPFVPATLSSAEFTRISALCGFIQSNGSGYGICRSCRAGALGGTRR